MSMGSPLRIHSAGETLPVAELAQCRLSRDCIQWFTRERQWINEQHVQLCRIPAPTFLEGKRAEWMIQQFRSIGCDARLDRGGNVIATTHAAARPPYVAVTAHLDTVLAPRTPEDIRVEQDGTMRGPGVSDNGAGLAALLALGRVFKNMDDAELTAPLLFIANVGEEGEGNLSGMRYLCKQSSLASKIRAFLVLDGPAIDHITYQALASRRFEITYTGNGGHSWSDFGVGNPIHALSRAMSLFIESSAGRQNGPRVSYNFGMIEGGSSVNSIATQARAKVDIRSEAAGRIDELVDILSGSVDRSLQVENERATGARVTARLKEIGSRPGGGLREDAPLLRYIRSVDSHLGLKSYLDCASTDANVPLSMNLPAVSIGAGGQGGGAHTPSEWFHPDGRENGLKRILLTLLLLLSEK
jgi:acetylornithine deacetylase/succinyl-diaminopimelate desuccinylase-like protein